MSQLGDSQAEKVNSPLLSLFIQTSSGFDEAHPHWRGHSVLISLRFKC